MAMTSNAVGLVQPTASVVGLLDGRSGRRARTFTLTCRFPSLGACLDGSPLRGRRPFLSIYHLVAMSAGIDREADATASARATATARKNAPDEPPTVGIAGRTDIDPDDLHQLVVEHSDAIFRLALSVVRDRALAEDVAQETLVKAWLALPTFRGDGSIRSWLLRITHNTAISTLRRRRAVVLDPQDLPERQNRVEGSVESRVQGHVVMDEFVAALDTLDELSRSIVVLRELEGLSYEEISEVLAVPMPTVKTRLLRARRRLGNVLRDWA